MINGEGLDGDTSPVYVDASIVKFFGDRDA